MLDIVIVNWNTGPLLADAVHSIVRHHEGLVASVTVVDNASADDSLCFLDALDATPFALQVLRNPDNRGFAAACNQGAARCDAEFLLFLNPDTRLFAGSLGRPLAFLRAQRNHKTGVCGVQLIDEAGQVSRSCARFPSALSWIALALGLTKLPGWHGRGPHMHDWDHAHSRDVDHVIGAFYLVRRRLFETLGGFDERFFVYLEDLDLSLRIRQAGWLSHYMAEAQAFHAGGGASRQVKAQRLFYSLRSRLQYAAKHCSRGGALAVAAATLLLEPMCRLLFAAAGARLDEARHTLRAYRLLYADALVRCRAAPMRRPSP